MVVSCCAYGCTERFSKTGPYTFHSFPKNEKRRNVWIKQIRRENFTVTNHTKICSKHFEADCFEGQLSIRRLTPNAIPTIFDFSDPVEKPEKPRKKKILAMEGCLTSTAGTSISADKNRYIGAFDENASASKGPYPLDPTVVIKEEPVEFEPTPSTSADPDCSAKGRLLLPHGENVWIPADSRSRPRADPAFQMTFSMAFLGTDQDKTSSNLVPGNPLKRKANPSKLSVSGQTQKVTRTSLDSGIVPTACLQTPLGNTDDSSDPSSLNKLKASDRPHDHFDAFGEYVAAKLRGLDKRSCAFVQKIIGDAIFAGEMGKFIEGRQ